MDTRYDPARELLRRYQPDRAPWRSRARTAPAARAWQRRVRPRLVATLGFDTPLVPGRVRLLSCSDRGDHVREQYEMTTALNVVMPFFLLRPAPGGKAPGSARLPLIVACTGHGYGAREIVGLTQDGRERAIPDGYQSDFAVQLCRRGFIVAVPEIAGFGQREHDFGSLAARGSPVPTTCRYLSTLAWHHGGSVLGMRVRDLRRMLDHLLDSPQIDPGRAGIMGISGGGMLALFTSAIDTRLRATVVSGYFSTFKDSILAMGHCWCNFVPGLGDFGEMHDLAALVAPRPLLVESGTQDVIFPITAVRAGLGKARRHYALHHADAALAQHLFVGGHRIDGRKAMPFLQQHLA